MNSQIYLDANATSATLPAAIAAADDAMRARFGNPSSSHAAGLKAKAMLDAVRSRARRLLGAGDGRLMFTSGATEGIQTAVLSALCDVRARQQAGEQVGDLLLYGATEHKAVPECLAHWNAVLGTGLALHALPVDADGRHRLDLLRQLAPRAALVCTMAANNETGVVSELAAIEALLADCAPAALWLVDSVQALGKLRLDLAATRIDYAPFSGHKLYAPKGIGMLYVRAGAPYTALMAGGGQEGGQRSGTENMAGIAALGAVLEALENGDAFRTHQQMQAFRERLAAALRQAFPGIVFNMPFAHSLPTTLNFSVPGLASKELLDVFDAAGVRVSSGSACSAAKAAPSYVLEAMGLPAWRSAAAVRMSFGPMADAAFIDAACARIERCGAALRASCLLPSGTGERRHDGVIQLAGDGACSYLVLDGASGSCVVIDPLEAQAERIAEIVRCQQLRVRAVLATGPDHARDPLLAALGELAPPDGADALGWPGASAAVALGDGSMADALALGSRLLVRLAATGDGALSYCWERPVQRAWWRTMCASPSPAPPRCRAAPTSPCRSRAGAPRCSGWRRWSMPTRCCARPSTGATMCAAHPAPKAAPAACWPACWRCSRGWRAPPCRRWRASANSTPPRWSSSCAAIPTRGWSTCAKTTSTRRAARRPGMAAPSTACRCRACRTSWPIGCAASSVRWCFSVAAAIAARARCNACTGLATRTPGTSPAASRWRPDLPQKTARNSPS